MATKTRLNIVFKDAGDENWTFSLSNYVDEDATDTEIKALANGIVTNKTAFEKGPKSVVSAEMVTTTSTPIDVSGE